MFIRTILNATVVISIVENSMQRLFKTDHYSMLKDSVYTDNCEIDCGTDQV